PAAVAAVALLAVARDAGLGVQLAAVVDAHGPVFRGCLRPGAERAAWTASSARVGLRAADGQRLHRALHGEHPDAVAALGAREHAATCMHDDALIAVPIERRHG